jgi:pyridinium-3,5-biscarboxylic acid mononucleotide sulfurtransferase
LQLPPQDHVHGGRTVHQRKFGELQKILSDCDSVCIGYSGGVDSVFLAVAATDTLGPSRVLAVTGLSPAYPAVQRAVAVDCAHRFGIPHLEVETDELSDPRYAANPSNRCYYCKSELWPRLGQVAAERGLRTVLDGSNADDADDYRPGFRAARENGVRSPLLEAGLTKAEVRELSRIRGLPTWEQPASPCLSSRLPYGVAVTPERLRQVETAESVLRELGFSEFRVRHHDDCLRLELSPVELPRAEAAGDTLLQALAAAPIALPPMLLDAEGYRRGALNEVLVQLAPAAAASAGSGTGGPAGGGAETDGSPWRAAGHHGDICVMQGCAARAREAAPAARAAGYRFIAVPLGGNHD